MVQQMLKLLVRALSRLGASAHSRCLQADFFLLDLLLRARNRDQRIALGIEIFEASFVEFLPI